MKQLALRKDYITLGQLLKAEGFAEDGVEAKLRISRGDARVNGIVETRRGKKLYDGDIVTIDDENIMIRQPNKSVS